MLFKRLFFIRLLSRFSMLNEKLKTKEDLSSEGLDEIAEAVGNSQDNFNEVFDLLYDGDFEIRSKAAKVLHKVSTLHPGLMEGRKRELFKQLPRMQNADVKVQMARILPHLQYDYREQKFVSDLLLHWLKAEVRNENVKLECMESLAQLAISDPFLRPEVIIEIEQQMFNGSTEIRNTGQKLLKKVRGY